MDDIDHILDRSHEFSVFLVEAISSAPPLAAGDRLEAAGAAADLSFEHAHALRILFEAWTPNSAVAILRLQYESLLRAAWVLHAASDAQVVKVSAPLDFESATAAKNLPGAEEMLRGLERLLQTQQELRGLVLPLREIRESAWTVMNAFVHAGLHPIARKKEGFPEQLVVSVVKISNGMLHMAARLLARLKSSTEPIRIVERCLLKFEDCLPIITPPLDSNRPLPPQAPLPHADNP